MYSLDTNICRLLSDREEHVVRKVLTVPAGQLFLSDVVVEEMIAGRLAALNAARTKRAKNLPEVIGTLYDDLRDTLALIAGFNRLPYTVEDELAYRELSPKIKRVGPQDCRVGVQAHRRGLIVVTRNVSDFEAVGIRCENWALREDAPL